MSNDPQYITIEEARQILGVTQRQVYRMAAEGRISTLQTPRGRLYQRSDVIRVATERGKHNENEVIARGSDNAQARQIANLLRQQTETLARLEQRPTDPGLIDRLDRIETALANLNERSMVEQPSGPPPWFYRVVAIAVIIGALALLALVFLR